MRCLPVVAVLALAGTAHAQAPGEIAPVAPQSAASFDRWSIHLAFGSAGYKIKDTSMDAVPFGTFELAGRYRFRPELELALELGGGGAMKGNLKAGGVFVDGRYRLFADKPWNLIGSVGLGLANVAGNKASDVQTKARPAIRLGLGVERRLHSFGLAATLRLIGIGANDQAPTLPATTETQFASREVSGLSFSVSGGYYF